MPEIFTIIYLVYIFIAIYFLALFALTFLQNRREIFTNPISERSYSVSVLVPAFSEADRTHETIGYI